MLIKARVSAGDRGLGEELLDEAEPLIYSSTLDFTVVEAASETRERIGEKLAARRGASQGFNIKLAPGGIRDIEFLVQCLQRLHGGRDRWVRHGGTLLALSRLRDKDLLSATEYSRLVSAYQFLRHLEHRLQFQEDRQTHTLPSDARRAGRAGAKAAGLAHRGRAFGGVAARFGEPAPRGSAGDLRGGHSRPAADVLHARVADLPGLRRKRRSRSSRSSRARSNLIRFLDQCAPQLASVLARTDLRRGRVHFEHFLERILPHPEWLDWLNKDTVLAGYVLDIFERSPYFAEQLIRNPELLGELRRMRASPGVDLPYAEEAASIDDAGELRRFFRREMFRIQAESMALETGIFETLERTSDLADAVIAAAYRMAVEQVAATHPPADGYKPDEQMMVVTMGRLGMREFDLASDADLVFVIPDEDVSEQAFWTRVAERMISIISAYTGDGMMFAVDTRLRPNGRSGALVQAESTYKSYFANTAEAWEGITYMKTRAVAGDIERGTAFLNELQKVDWRRYGQSGRSRKQLLQMRLRLEKEQGGENPLKAGRGGYYDIDFALMYLRLKGAGIFYKVLNTPARIDVIEQMGHLERADADFLRDAAIFYRALDHGVRVSTGHAGGTLPIRRFAARKPQRAGAPLDARSSARPAARHRTGADPGPHARVLRPAVRGVANPDSEPRPWDHRRRPPRVGLELCAERVAQQPLFGFHPDRGAGGVDCGEQRDGDPTAVRQRGRQSQAVQTRVDRIPHQPVGSRRDQLVSLDEPRPVGELLAEFALGGEHHP